MPKIIHRYDPSSREYLGAINAQVSPVESTKKKTVYLPQANTVDFAPAAQSPAGMASVLNAAGDAWTDVEDHRGENMYDTTTGAESTVDAPGALPTGQTLTPPPPNSVWSAKQKAWVFDVAKGASAAQMRISGAYQDSIGQLTAGYSDAEQKTWQTQLNQARAYVANNTASTPALDALVAARGTTKAVIAPLIIAKAEALELASLTLTGKYQKLTADIAALTLITTTTQADFDAVIW